MKQNSIAKELIASIGEAVEIMEGRREPARIHAASDAVDVRAIRERMGLTRQQFSERFGLKPTAVRDWEQHLRRPDPAAQTLLRVIARHPDAVADAVASA